MQETAFLALTVLGVFALVGGMVRARLYWRADISPYGRVISSWDVLLHPERYAERRAVRTIRALFLAGLIGVGGGVVVLLQKAVHDFARVIR